MVENHERHYQLAIKAQEMEEKETHEVKNE